MKFEADNVVSTMIGFFITLTLFGAFFPLIQTAVGNLGLDNITIGTTTLDLSGLGYVFVFGMLMLLIVPSLNLIRTKRK